MIKGVSETVDVGNDPLVEFVEHDRSTSYVKASADGLTQIRGQSAVGLGWPGGV